MDDWASTTKKAERFIAEHVSSSNSKGVVFGLSGGVDSAVIAYLCCGALGPQKCLALIMPNSEFTPSSETDDGILVAQRLGIPHVIIPIESISHAATIHDTDRGNSDAQQLRVIGNLNARLRSVLLYYEAQKRDYLVVGTDDRSEHMIGYFTKHGDGACDILPIAEIYKTQVWNLARHLGVPEHIINKEPSPHLWKGHSISTELGMNYEMIDAILAEMQESGSNTSDANTISKKLKMATDHVDKVLQLNRSSEHKRHMPPIADLAGLHHQSHISTTKSNRPWGNYERFTLNSRSTVKMITINPGASLSLQRHNHRSEFWQVVSGEAIATLNGKKIVLREGDNLLVPVGATHRLTGGTDCHAKILEVAIGDFSEEDIVRLEDDWGRK